MVEKTTLAKVQHWGIHNFINRGYNFDIRLETFGDSKYPVIHIFLTNCGNMNFDFPIILDNYYPKYSDRDEFDFGDKVVVDFELFDKTFHEEVKNFYVNISNKKESEVK